VLSVVDKVARIRVFEGIGASTELGFSFQQRDPEPTLRQRDPGAQAAEPAANHDDILRIDHSR